MGESNGPGSGNIGVDSELCVDGYCLKLDGDDFAGEWGIYRAVDLENAASATLSFSYKRIFENNAEIIAVPVFLTLKSSQCQFPRC